MAIGANATRAAPSTKYPSPWVGAWRILRQAVCNTSMQLVKHAITEGDKIALTALGADPAILGAYAVAHNYGSLVARLAFVPIEESLRLVFGQLFAEAREGYQ